MAVVAQHTSGHVTRDLHDCLVACSTLGKFRDQGVSVIVPPARYLCISAPRVQGCLECRDMTGRIRRTRSTKWKYVPLRLDWPKFDFELGTVLDNGFVQ